MKFFPKVVKSKLRLVRFLKNKLNVAKKSLQVAKFIAKSMISSKGNACEMQNLQGTWKFPCTSQAIYLTCKLLARCMEISMYLATKHTSRYMEISMYLATKHTSRYMEISMYLAMKHMARYMEISMYLAMKHTERYVEISMYLAIKHMARYMAISKYLAMKHMARYMEISMYLAMKHNARYMGISMHQLPYVSLQGTWKFPCTLQTKHMTKHSLPCFVAGYLVTRGGYSLIRA